MPPTSEINLDFIHMSRYQQRDGEDQQHIDQLAISIARVGLQQIPAGRLIVGATEEPLTLEQARKYGSIETAFRNNVRVELAYGNSRLAAFILLHKIQTVLCAKTEPSYASPGVVAAAQAVLDTGYIFDKMPVVLCDMTDLEQFELGIRENHDRKNLNPIELARAMEAYRTQFGKNSQEIGQLFHLADSTVRGLVRLLRLDDSTRHLVSAGEIAQGQARALVPLFEDLSEADRLRAEDQDFMTKPSEIIEIACSGTKPEMISQMVAELVSYYHPKPVQAVIDLPAAEARPAPAVETIPQFPGIPLRRGEIAQTVPSDWDPLTPAPAPIPTPSEPVRHESAVSIAPALAGAYAYGHAEADDQAEYKEQPQAKEIPAQETRPAPAAQPAPAKPSAQAAEAPAQSEAPLPLEKSTLMLTLTYWPSDDNPAGRMVAVAARVNNGAPMMRMYRENALELVGPAAQLLRDLKAQFGGV